MQSATLSKIDVASVLKAKLPRHYRYIPRWVVRRLEKIICQEQLNELLGLYSSLQGTDFAAALIKHLDVKIRVRGLENIPPHTTRLIFASNHPLGAFDGIALISLLGPRYPDAFRFIVNDMLMAIPPLRSVFLPVNKVGSQSHAEAQGLLTAMAGDCAIATFPAGLCSRNTHGSVIEDLRWRRTFITHARRYNRTIVPVYFDGQNSSLFYRIARWRKEAGIKFNIEMIMLPSEMFKSAGKTFTVTFGTPITPQELTPELTDDQWATAIRNRAYALK